MELNSENLEKYAHRMKEELDLKGVVVTLGKEEVFIQNPGQKYKIIPTRAKEVYDVSGAGDTFTAIFSMVSSLEDNWFIASDIVNHGSGIV